jgi:hypothetical protein
LSRFFSGFEAMIRLDGWDSDWLVRETLVLSESLQRPFELGRSPPFGLLTVRRPIECGAFAWIEALPEVRLEDAVDAVEGGI